MAAEALYDAKETGSALTVDRWRAAAHVAYAGVRVFPRQKELLFAIRQSRAMGRCAIDSLPTQPDNVAGDDQRRGHRDGLYGL